MSIKVGLTKMGVSVGWILHAHILLAQGIVKLQELMVVNVPIMSEDNPEIYSGSIIIFIRKLFLFIV